MTKSNQSVGKDRRTFMKEMAAVGGTAVFAGWAANFGEPSALAGQATSSTSWSKKIGLELYTVRDLMADQKGYISTLEKSGRDGLQGSGTSWRIRRPRSEGFPCIA